LEKGVGFRARGAMDGCSGRHVGRGVWPELGGGSDRWAPPASKRREGAAYPFEENARVGHCLVLRLDRNGSLRPFLFFLLFLLFLFLF
jgi:hypothetical protein